MTGMGADGAKGLLAMHEARLRYNGAIVILAEHADTLTHIIALEIMLREQIVVRLADMAVVCDGRSIGMRMSRLRRLMRSFKQRGRELFLAGERKSGMAGHREGRRRHAMRCGEAYHVSVRFWLRL